MEEGAQGQHSQELLHCRLRKRLFQEGWSWVLSCVHGPGNGMAPGVRQERSQCPGPVTYGSLEATQPPLAEAIG